MAEDTLRTSCEIDGLAQAADPSLRLSTEEIHFLQDLEVQEQEEVAREAGKSEEDIAREAAEADRAHIAEPEVQLSEVGEIKVDMTRFMGPPSEVLPHLFLGSAWNARVAATLQHNGITHVLNVASNCPQMNHPGLNVVHMPISYSYKGANSFDKFEEMFNFIDAAKESGGKVLVHCMRGNSRSVCVVLCYLIARMQYSLPDAYVFVKRKRPKMRPVDAVQDKARVFEELHYKGPIDKSFSFYY
eukprot:TRINITY_DN1459_c0_g1_i1.p1 TRINITY_DN1459_c0_g1~~TRINITY_DN1459_c0_g1_i1.p1  ORF type:complete len:244 (+),score=78.96 TRINITY_DN1459_c0_g1_i1:133-864(+)